MLKEHVADPFGAAKRGESDDDRWNQQQIEAKRRRRQTRLEKLVAVERRGRVGSRRMMMMMMMMIWMIMMMIFPVQLNFGLRLRRVDEVENETEDDRANQRQPLQSHLYVKSIFLCISQNGSTKKEDDALKSREDKWGLHKCEAVTQNNKMSRSRIFEAK